MNFLNVFACCTGDREQNEPNQEVLHQHPEEFVEPQVQNNDVPPATGGELPPTGDVASAAAPAVEGVNAPVVEATDVIVEDLTESDFEQEVAEITVGAQQNIQEPNDLQMVVYTAPLFNFQAQENNEVPVIAATPIAPAPVAAAPLNNQERPLARNQRPRGQNVGFFARLLLAVSFAATIITASLQNVTKQEQNRLPSFALNDTDNSLPSEVLSFENVTTFAALNNTNFSLDADVQEQNVSPLFGSSNITLNDVDLLEQVAPVVSNSTDTTVIATPLQIEELNLDVDGFDEYVIAERDNKQTVRFNAYKIQDLFNVRSQEQYPALNIPGSELEQTEQPATEQKTQTQSADNSVLKIAGGLFFTVGSALATNKAIRSRAANANVIVDAPVAPIMAAPEAITVVKIEVHTAAQPDAQAVRVELPRGNTKFGAFKGTNAKRYT